METLLANEVLEKILLPLNTSWLVEGVNIEEKREEIFVKLRYKFDYVEDNGVRYSIYDHHKVRKMVILIINILRPLRSLRVPCG